MNGGERIRVVASIYKPMDDPIIGGVGTLLRPLTLNQRTDGWLVAFDDGRRLPVFECEMEQITRENEMARRHPGVEVETEPEVKRGRGRPRKGAAA